MTAGSLIILSVLVIVRLHYLNSDAYIWYEITQGLSLSGRYICFYRLLLYLFYCLERVHRYDAYREYKY